MRLGEKTEKNRFAVPFMGQQMWYDGFVKEKTQQAVPVFTVTFFLIYVEYRNIMWYNIEKAVKLYCFADL